MTREGQAARAPRSAGSVISVPRRLVTDGARRARWIAAKVASQSPGYFPRRAHYAARRQLVDRVFPSAHMLQRARFTVPRGVTLKEHLLSRAGPAWHFDPHELDGVVAAVPAEVRERAVRAAEQVVERKFTFRGIGPIHLDPMRWDVGPEGERAWTWDLNRHGILATLGFAYQYTNDSRFVHAFRALSDDWIRTNAASIGRLEWDTPFEVAARVNSWLWALFLFLPAPEWLDDHAARFVACLGLLTEYLHQAIEFHSPGNHILLEAKALALCAEILPEFDGAASWRARSWQILRDEIDEQICSDGVHAERSTMYHRIVAGELCELALVASAEAATEGVVLASAVERMADFERWIDLGDGSSPVFGDGYETDSYLRFGASRVLDALACGTEHFEPATDYEAWLLARRLPQDPSASADQVTVAGSKAFPEGGYFVSRSPETTAPSVLVWDCGPIGYARNRKHAHLDALSFVLSVSGRPLIIDPGTDESSERALGLRATAAHNTVMVDGTEQAILAERNEIWSPPIPTLRLWSTSSDLDVMEGAHDGYRRLSDSVLHVRTIVNMHGAFWLVLDRLEGAAEHRLEQRFHVAPAADAELLSEQEALLTLDDQRITMQFLVAGTRIDASHVDLTVGTAELRFGEPRTIAVLTQTTTGRLPIMQIAALARESLGLVVADSNIDATTVAVSTAGVLYHVNVAHGAVPRARVVAERETDARACVLVNAGAGDRTFLVAGSGTHG